MIVTCREHVVRMVFRNVSDCNGDLYISDDNGIRVALTCVGKAETNKLRLSYGEKDCAD